MRNSCVALIVTLFLGGPTWGQRAPVATRDQAAIVAFTQKAVERALDYDQDNRESLTDAQGDFTPDGWREFMKWLEGYVDDKGAPTGSSLFTPTGNPVVKHQENDVTQLTIPGNLKQEQKNANGGVIRTTYRVTVDVQVGGRPFKIQHLKVITCGGASMPSCQ